MSPSCPCLHRNISNPHRGNFPMGLLLVFCCIATIIHADTIGLNFIGGSFLGGVPTPLAASDLAGYVPQRFWNNASSYSGSVPLQGDVGAGFAAYYSGCSATWTAGIETWATPITDLAGNNR